MCVLYNIEGKIEYSYNSRTNGVPPFVRFNPHQQYEHHMYPQRNIASSSSSTGPTNATMLMPAPSTPSGYPEGYQSRTGPDSAATSFSGQMEL
jgi:hypothetical protein